MTNCDHDWNFYTTYFHCHKCDATKPLSIAEQEALIAATNELLGELNATSTDTNTRS